MLPSLKAKHSPFKEFDMSILIKSIITLSFVALAGCQQNSTNITDSADEKQAQTAPARSIESAAQVETSNQKEKIVSLKFKGTIKLIELEGGFYGIVTDDGQKILPMNLNPEYLQDGAEIEFSGHYKNVMTIQQWGKPFTITEIKLIKAGKKKSNPEY